MRERPSEKNNEFQQKVNKDEMEFGDTSNYEESDIQRVDTTSEHTQMVKFDDSSSMNSFNTDMKRVDDSTSNYSGFTNTQMKRFEDGESEMQRIEEDDVQHKGEEDEHDEEGFQFPNNKDMDKLNGPMTEANKNRSQSSFVKGGFKKANIDKMEDLNRDRNNTGMPASYVNKLDADLNEESFNDLGNAAVVNANSSHKKSDDFYSDNHRKFSEDNSQNNRFSQ